MKKIALLLITLFVSDLNSQKKELRQVDKLISQSFFDEALSELSKIESLVLSSEDKYKADFYYKKTKVSTELKNFKDAIFSYNSLESIESNNYSNTIKVEIDMLKSNIETSLVNSAVEDNQNEKFEDASDKLFMAYNLDKVKNIDYLYYAAGSAVNSKNYDTALKHYIELKELNYTGIVDEFYVTNKSTGIEEKVDESQYKVLQKSKDYINPRVGQTPSRYPEIVKNIALIFVQQGKNDIAIEAINEARNIQPEDTGLILNEADLYIRLSNSSNDSVQRINYRLKFKSLMELAITKEPENGILYYNLGVISGEQGEIDDAINYYQKAISLKPDYVDAYLNLVSEILKGEESIIDEMNNLGTSRRDNLRYDELKVIREDLYKKCIPFLEDLIGIAPENLSALNTLKNIYGVIGDNDGFRAISAKISELEN